ncbi:hypothetical protein [Fluviispira vulneris]|uniref:hypothetical protein n=1 Tax=Fluviispira vulneris TaxID=2763012 RepID=UPI001645BF3E|nr:hypothetical protein [Fluviispira vulneris]
MYLKSLACVLSSVVSVSIYAQTESKVSKNIDLFANLGFSYLNDIVEPIKTTDAGVELGFFGLYSLPSYKNVTPVIGGGLHSSAFRKKLSQSVNLPSVIQNVLKDPEFNISWASLEANAGVKINPVANLNLFALANLGYASNTKTTIEFSNIEIGSTSKNHYYYGATLIGTVPLTDTMSIGGSFTYNRHQMSSNKIFVEDLSFNQYTTSLVLQYSI